MTIKTYVIIGTIVITLLISSVSNVFAGGPRFNYPDDGDTPKYEDDCHINGYDSGFAGKYDSERAKDCLENGDDAYNFAWGIGCEDGVRTEEECGELINNPVEVEDYEALEDEITLDCSERGVNDSKANLSYDKARAEGCYEFGGKYKDGFKSECQKNFTESDCDLVIEGEERYCPEHPDIAACVPFLRNDSNKQIESNHGVCGGMGDPRPDFVCFQESNPERHCLNHTNNTEFCDTIGDICDEDGFVKPEYPYCKNG